MYKEVFAALLLGVVAFPALSDEEGVLIPDIASISNSEDVVNLVAQALIGRQWTIKAKDRQSVTAELEGLKLRISISGTSLMYWDSAAPAPRAVGPVGVQQAGAKDTRAARWRANLKKDLTVLLAQRQFQNGSERASAQPAQSVASIAERLKVVESLKDSGAITEAEYAKKRAEILDSL